MQVLQEAEHDFFWGKPSDSGQGRGVTAPGGGDVARLPTSSAAAADGGSLVVAQQAATSQNGSPEGNRSGVVPCVQGSPAPRVVTADVSPSRLHGIIAAATLEDLSQALVDTLQASTAGTAVLEPYFGRGGSGNNHNWDTDESSDQRLNRADLEGAEGHAGAAVTGIETGSSAEVEVEEVVVALPPEVVEVALAKTAGWALDAGTFSGIDPAAVRRTIDLLQASMRHSRMTGYSLDHAESALWSLSSILGCYDWAPADGTTAVVQSWLCRTDTLEQIQGCGRFAVLVSLLWGYAGLLQAQMRGVGERMQGTEVPYGVGGAAAAAERLPPSPPPPASLDASLDVLTCRAAELLRMSYDVGQPVDAAELTDAAWGLHVVGRMSPGSLELARAVAHEVYRQLSNRYSLQTAFTPGDLVKVVQSYAGMQLSDGSVARMLDAVGGHVAKRICSRHIHAVTRPADCAALLQAFADTGHNSVVVPELLGACALQISREVATHNEAFGPAITVAPAAAAPSASSSGPSASASTPQPASGLGHGPAPSSSSGADSSKSAGVSGGSSSSISGGGGGKSGKSGGVVSRFKLPHVPLWRRPFTTQTAQAAFWHWSTFLPPAQILAVLESYTRMGFVPRPTLLNSLLLAAQPQLPYMNASQVSELLQLLAAVRHVPGDQTLASLAAAALRPHPIGGEEEAAADGNQLRPGSLSVPEPSSQPAHGVRQRRSRRDSAPVQRLRALWALAMMGWEAEPEEVEDVLDPVLLDGDLVLGLEDAGRLMSLLCLLYSTPGAHSRHRRHGTQAPGRSDGDSRTPTGGLTIQRFGLACTKLRDTMAHTRSGGGGGSDLRDDVLLATGTAMTLLGFEGWEMAEQVLSASAFRKVEAAVRQALERPYDSLDMSLVRTLKRAVDEVPGCSAAVESIAVPIVVPEVEGGAAASQCPGAGSSGPGASYHNSAPDPDSLDDDAAAAYYEPLTFRPLVGRLAPDGGEQAEAGTVVRADPSRRRKADGEDREGPGGVEPQGPAPPRRADGALQDGGEIVVFDICDKPDYASNTTGQLLWGSARVRHLLYDACAPGRLLVVDGRTLSSLQGSQEAAVTYARCLVQHRHVPCGGLRW